MQRMTWSAVVSCRQGAQRMNPVGCTEQAIQTNHWDAVVIGTGMSGSAVGWGLAKAGWHVLFLEKGHSHLHRKSSITGDFAETFLTNNRRVHRNDIFRRAGRWTEEVDLIDGSSARSTTPFLGCGTGGSSSIYGLALERFQPSDFTPGRFYKSQHEANVPETWPISYQELEPYYMEAECLFGLTGEPDPLDENASPRSLRRPPPLQPAHQEVFKSLRDLGVHPYRLPVACDYTKDSDRVQGFLLPTKRDASTVFLQPALSNFGAALLDDCEVARLDVDKSQIKEIHGMRSGNPFVVRCKHVIMAAGALATPRILLQSANRQNPRGLSNRSDQVGRNLMRHYIDLYVLNTHASFDSNCSKELGLNDFYVDALGKWGTVQSFGVLPPPEILVEGLAKELCEQGAWLRSQAVRLAGGVLKYACRKALHNKPILTSILEDLPYAENRVTLAFNSSMQASGRLKIHYSIDKYGKQRIIQMRQKLLSLLKPFKPILLKQAENHARLAHACGTCRFGLRPSDSVLNAQNRAHEIDNLYVVDASFLPTSAGTNPSLTLAANSLRVARHLIDQDSKSSASIAHHSEANLSLR